MIIYSGEPTKEPSFDNVMSSGGYQAPPKEMAFQG